MKSLIATYTHGTRRLASPEQTLMAITPYLRDCGITRCADITGLDLDLGVPTFAAIRPYALSLQVSNGKGLTPMSAKVSALMEAIEFHHAENPEPNRLQNSSLKTLFRSGLNGVRPEKLDGYYHHFFFDDFIIDWVEGKNLLSDAKIWVPASAVYFGCQPSLYNTSTNGLASGNHLVEGALHALYEVIERDAISKISINGRLKIKERCKNIDLSTIADESIQKIIDKIRMARSKLVLLWTESCVPVHTFWAIILNKAPFSAVSTVNVGWGTHLDKKVAASRAITEAVQSRLTFIHGAREDLIDKPVYSAESPQSSFAYNYFDRLETNTSWQALSDQVKYENDDLLQNFDYLLSKLSGVGHNQILQFDLTKPEFKIPVVKIIVPTLSFNRKLF